MKKLMFMVMCACAIGFTSCGNKAQQAPADEVVASDEAIDVEAAIGEATAQLTEQIEANDAGKLQQALEAIQAKIAEILKANPDAAKEYVAKVQDFLKENADKIKAVAGENAAVQAAVSALTAAPAETIVSGLMQAVDGVKAAGEDAVDLAPRVVDGVHRFLVAFVPVLGVVNMGFDGLKHLLAPFGIAADGRRGNVGNLDDFLLSRLDFPDGRQDLLLEHFERFLHKPTRFIDALGLRLEFLGDLCAPVLDGGLELRELGVHRLAGLEPLLGVNVGNQPTRNLLDLVEHRDKVLLVKEKRLRVHAVRLDRELFSLVDKDERVGVLFFHHF